jgi:8-oxo-dGTP diphosphatase
MITDWSVWQPNMLATLLFVVRDDQVLLIHKKTGLGAGKINGPGGKIEPGETPVEGAVREIEEELCIVAADPVEVGTLRFAFVDGLHIHCTVFRSASFTGEPTETHEAKPQWFRFDEIPYDQMWADDRHWLPRMLQGERFDSWFEFDGETMLSKRIEWIGRIDDQA